MPVRRDWGASLLRLCVSVHGSGEAPDGSEESHHAVNSSNTVAHVEPSDRRVSRGKNTQNQQVFVSSKGERWRCLFMFSYLPSGGSSVTCAGPVSAFGTLYRAALSPGRWGSTRRHSRHIRLSATAPGRSRNLHAHMHTHTLTHVRLGLGYR